MNESDGRLMPYEEVPKDVVSITKKKFITSKEKFLQAARRPMISTLKVARSKSLVKGRLGQVLG